MTERIGAYVDKVRKPLHEPVIKSFEQTLTERVDGTKVTAYLMNMMHRNENDWITRVLRKRKTSSPKLRSPPPTEYGYAKIYPEIKLRDMKLISKVVKKLKR